MDRWSRRWKAGEDAKSQLKDILEEVSQKRDWQRGSVEQLLSDQFERYFIEPGVHHTGRLVLGESIGDLAGAKIAYRALQIAQKTRPGRAVDGFTPDQQFFIAWGQARYDNTRPERAPHGCSRIRTRCRGTV